MSAFQIPLLLFGKQVVATERLRGSASPPCAVMVLGVNLMSANCSLI